MVGDEDVPLIPTNKMRGSREKSEKALNLEHKGYHSFCTSQIKLSNLKNN